MCVCVCVAAISTLQCCNVNKKTNFILNSTVVDSSKSGADQESNIISEIKCVGHLGFSYQIGFMQLFYDE